MTKARAASPIWVMTGGPFVFSQPQPRHAARALGLSMLVAAMPAFARFPNLTCAEANSECPASVGMVVAFDKGGHASTCVGTLIASDQVLTAAHCVPRALRASGASVNGARLAFAPVSGRSYSWVERVDSISVTNDPTRTDEEEDSAETSEASTRTDVALLRLQKPLPTAPMRISTEGLPAGARDFRTYVFRLVDHSTLSYELVEEHCQLSEFFFGTGFEHDAKSPLIHLHGCSFDHGDSGAPLVAEDGTAWGLGVEFVHFDPNTPRGAQLELVTLRPPEISIFASNLACTDGLAQRAARCDWMFPGLASIYDANARIDPTLDADDVLTEDLFWRLAERAAAPLLEALPRLSPELGNHLVLLDAESDTVRALRDATPAEEWERWLGRGTGTHASFAFGAPHCLVPQHGKRPHPRRVTTLASMPIFVIRRGVSAIMTPRVEVEATGAQVLVSVVGNSRRLTLRGEHGPAVSWPIAKLPLCEGSVRGHADSVGVLAAEVRE